MRYTELVKTWPSDMRAAQPNVLQAIRDGHFLPPKWTTLELRHPSLPGVSAQVKITNDALRFGDAAESKRVAMSHATAQAIADLLDLRTPTMWILDNAAAQAPVRIEPIHQTKSSGGEPIGHTSKRVVAEEHSDALDRAIARRPGLVITVGKDWLNSNRLLTPEREKWGKQTAINGGWHTDAPPVMPPTPGPRPGLVPGVQSWQREGGAHDVSHVDPSQWNHYVDPAVLINTGGIIVPWSIDLLAMDPILGKLVKHDGPGPMRHPWLPVCQSLADGGSCGAPPSGPGPGPGPSTPPVAATRSWVMPVAVAGAAIGLAVAVTRWAGVASAHGLG